MGCIYCDLEGKCENWGEGNDSELCADQDGYCMCDEDEDPACSMFESDEYEEDIDDEEEEF